MMMSRVETEHNVVAVVAIIKQLTWDASVLYNISAYSLPVLIAHVTGSTIVALARRGVTDAWDTTQSRLY